jgi:GT2 family glycosyltransferase
MKNPDKIFENYDSLIKSQGLNNNSQEYKNRIASIVVPLYNNLAFTKEFIDSVILNTTPEFEIIFIDNASTDETKNYLNSILTSNQNVKVILNENNLGFPKAVNQGIQAAKGKYILIANNDIVVTEGWLEKLI